MLKKLLIIFLISSALLLTYLYFQNNGYENEIEEKNEITNNEKEKTRNIEKDPAKLDAHYFEEVVVLEEQPMYYAYPLEIKEDQPPELIIYSHGQLQRVVENLDDEYMLILREYGEFFASKGYAFSASNQHGDNWGQKESLSDIKNSVLWFEDSELPIAKKKYMIGFSMGGRTAVNYSIENNKEISKIALLAPTPRENLSQNDVDKVSKTPIKIWHGTEDINIPFSVSEYYVKSFENFGKEIKLEPIKEAGHYDIEKSLMNEILEFFKD